MRRFVCCALLPAVVVVGLITLGAEKAEARRWVRRAPARVVVVRPPAPIVVQQPTPVVVRQPASVVVRPRPYYYRYYNPYRRPGVNVNAPGVRVNVGPRGYGGSVIAPGVRIGW